MKIVILAVGKSSTSPQKELEDVYTKRLRPYTEVEWKILPAARSTDPLMAKDEESDQIIATLKPNDSVILLDERGQQQTNEQFAETFERLAGTHGRLVIIIGGAFGVNDALRERAAFVWSFSELVFPHQLIRIMLLEQLYRTYMVLNNHPYHHN